MSAFSTAAFLGSFLLFTLELIVARLLLPGFGGSAAVWTASMMFYQGVFLAGNVYAYASLRRLATAFSTRLHLVLIALPFLLLPIAVLPPRGVEHPLQELLGSLVRTAALPLFALSATVPVLSMWQRGHAAWDGSPYRLYAASNAGALTALLLYPFLLEPLLSLSRQLILWSLVYGLFIIAHFLCRPARGAELAAEVSPTKSTLKEILVWLAFSAGPCAAMLAATNTISYHLGSLPAVWALPLALYLTTFILNFKRDPVKADLFVWPLILLAGLLSVPLMISFLRGSTGRAHEAEGFILIIAGLFFSLAVLFLLGMICHRQLVLTAPEAGRAPVFYTTIALGGWLGSLLIGVAVPCLGRYGANLAIDWSIAFLLCAAGWIALSMLGREALLGLSFGRLKALAVGMAIGGLLMFSSAYQRPRAAVAAQRTFYGVYRVEDSGSVRRFIHGNTVHGIQYLEKDKSLVPIGYYHEKSPIGRFLKAPGGDFKKIGVVGLGAGALAAYGRSEQVWDFFELDPQVEEIARKHFSYLDSSRSRVKVITGDARLALEKSSETYDLLILDAFASGAIPIHLATREAHEIYLRRLKPGGLILSNISSRVLDLRPAMSALAGSLNLLAWAADCDTGSSDGGERFNCRWTSMSQDGSWAVPLSSAGFTPLSEASGTGVWTDQHASLLTAIRFAGH